MELPPSAVLIHGGHHDRIGLNDSAPMKSWNASHPTRNCTMDGFKATGGGGRFYCFASN